MLVFGAILMSLPRGLHLGHSSGWLFAALGNQYRLADFAACESGASAIEISATSADRIAALGREEKTPSSELKFVSLHLPDMCELRRYSSGKLHSPEYAIQSLVTTHNVCAAAIHPDHLDDESATWLKRLDVPFAIENMDRRPQTGRTVKEVQRICAQFGCPLVLDVQHAYENSIDNGGNGIDLAVELTRSALAQNGISYLHVSGEMSKEGLQYCNHASLVTATNRETIIEAVLQIEELAGFTLPIICEGDYLYQHSAQLQASSPDSVSTYLSYACTRMREERELLQARLIERWNQRSTQTGLFGAASAANSDQNVDNQKIVAGKL